MRQNEAVFAHLKQLSEAAEEVRAAEKGKILAVAASTAPRDGAESYMPVFMAGASYGRLAAAALGVPFFGTTHQRGHLAAAKAGTELAEAEEYLALHLSGGTTDLLEVRRREVLQIGGSLDLHAGQLVDRAGVAMGLDFLSSRAGAGTLALSEKRRKAGMQHGGRGPVLPFQRCGKPGPAMDPEGKLSREDTARKYTILLARTICRMLAAGLGTPDFARRL